MAVATYTSTVYASAGAKSVHTGNVSVGGKIVHSGTVGDILFLAKVPHGARVVDFVEYHSNGETAAAYSFGFSKGIAAGGAGNHSCLIISGTLASTNRMSLGASPSGAPVVISLSDLDPVRHAILTAKAEAGTFTISSSIAFTLTYRMDEARE